MALHATRPQQRRQTSRGRTRHEETPPHEFPWQQRAAQLPVEGPLSPYVDMFFAVTEHSPTTVYHYKRHLSKLSLAHPTFGPADFTTLHLMAFLAKNFADRAPETRKKPIVTFRQFFGWLHDTGVIDKNPADPIKPPKILTPEPRYLDPDDVNRLLKAAHRDLAFCAAIGLAAYAGMRRGSIHALKWEDVDLEGRTITIRHAKGGKHYIVPMAPKLRTILQVWKEASRENDCGYVYAHERRGHWRPLYYSSTGKRFHKYAKIVGISEDAGLHDLRRTFATTLHNQGVDITVISRLLGHASVSTTMNHYAFTSDRLKMEAVMSLDY